MELLSEIYFWALFSAGIGISLWGFRKKQSKGYLLIAAYFLSPFIGLIHQEISFQIHKEEVDRINEEKNMEIKPVMAQEEIPAIIEQNIQLPLFESFLVVGLLFTVKKQRIEIK